MSHNIEIYADGTASFISARESAWHHLGIVKPEGYLSLDEMFAGSRADFQVWKIPIQGVDLTSDGVTLVENPDHMMTVRHHPTVPGKRMPLGVVGKNYKVIQNREGFEFGQTLLGAGTIGETAGVLNGGKRAFACFRIQRTLMIGGIDPVNTYLVVSLGHDGTASYKVIRTHIRVVCQNTLNLAIAGAAAKWTLKHTKNAVLHEAKAREILGVTGDALDKFQAIGDQLLNKKITNRRFEQIITAEFGPKEDAKPAQITQWEQKRDQLMWLFTMSDTQANIKGTAWAAWNTITEYCAWFTAVYKVPSTDVYAKQFERMLDGNYDDVQHNMQRILLEA